MKIAKRVVLSLLAVAMVVAIALSAFACGEQNIVTVAGLSAYDIAVKHGETKSEEEWLASLSQGKSAYDIAKEEDETVGTKEEWLESLKGADGKDGTDGKNAAITIGDLYEEYKKAYKEAYGTDYAGTYIEFMQEYFAQTYESISTQSMVADAVRSCVSVYSTFNYTVQQYDRWFRVIGTTVEQKTSGGAGVIYKLNKETGDAYIITNYHVVYSADADESISDNICVLLYGYEKVYEEIEGSESDVKRKYAIPATYIGGSMKLDVAVLYVHDCDLLKGNNSDAQEATIADSNTISIGEDAIAIGNPQAKGIAVTRGVIAVDSENNTMLAADDKTSVTFRVIRIDTAINAGNSGGGLFNEKGEVIGIVHAKSVASDVDNIAYAIPANIAVYTAQGIIARFEANNKTGSYKATKCLLGVMLRATASRSYYDSETKRIVVEEEVTISDDVSSTADAYGKLQKGDIIRKIKIGDLTLDVTRTYIVTDATLLGRVGDSKYGSIEVTYVRDGVESTCTIQFTQNYEIDSI